MLAAILAALDQLSKWAMTELVLRPHGKGITEPLSFIDWYRTPPIPLEFIRIEMTSFFNLVMVWNKGVSFGMMNQAGDMGPWLLTAVALAITAVFVVILYKSPVSFQSVGIAMVIGGAIGNVIDRVRFRAVIDFLDFHYNDYHWPAFNLADSYVCVGVAILIIGGLFFSPKT